MVCAGSDVVPVTLKHPRQSLSFQQEWKLVKQLKHIWQWNNFILRKYNMHYRFHLMFFYSFLYTIHSVDLFGGKVWMRFRLSSTLALLYQPTTALKRCCSSTICHWNWCKTTIIETQSMSVHITFWHSHTNWICYGLLILWLSGSLLYCDVQYFNSVQAGANF